MAESGNPILEILPTPVALRAMGPIERHNAMTQIAADITQLIEDAHAVDHQRAKQASEAVDHSWTADVQKGCRLAIAERYGADPEVLVSILIEVCTDIALVTGDLH